VTDILGISALYHDSAACLVRDGTIFAAAQEERFTRKKQDPGFPRQAVRYGLHEARCAFKDLRALVGSVAEFVVIEATCGVAIPRPMRYSCELPQRTGSESP
jgi:predicted NodU family carbamoyl transferase